MGSVAAVHNDKRFLKSKLRISQWSFNYFLTSPFLVTHLCKFPSPTSLLLSIGKANVPSMLERYQNMPKSKISYNEAITAIVNESIKRPKEIVYKNVEDYGNFGYFSVDEVRSPMDLPPFRASLKDGYAVRSADGNADRFTMSKPIAAGESDCDQLKANHCYRINTGRDFKFKYCLGPRL